MSTIVSCYNETSNGVTFGICGFTVLHKNFYIVPTYPSKDVTFTVEMHYPHKYASPPITCHTCLQALHNCIIRYSFTQTAEHTCCVHTF